MKNTKTIKKLTVRVIDCVYDRLNLRAKEKHISVNKVISSILQEYTNTNQTTQADYITEIDNKLKNINDSLEKISKRQYKHFKLSQQHFANFGYLSNADIREDKCLNEVLNNKDNFNE